MTSETTEPAEPDAQEPVVIVTGTSTGIGLATAVSAAVAGWRVIATVRRPGSEQELLAAAGIAGVELDVRLLDVTDARASAALVADVVSVYGRLDAVVNNAGAGHVGTLETDTLEAIREVMEVNYFGVVNVSKPSMEPLRASRGILITVTSVGGIVGQPFNESYCAAKFAVEGLMESLHPVAAAVGVRVVVVEPGAVATSFVASVRATSDADSLAGAVYSEAFDHYIERTGTSFANAQQPQGVADVIVSAMTADAVPFRLQSSDGATAFVGAKLRDLDGSVVTGLTSTWVAP